MTPSARWREHDSSGAFAGIFGGVPCLADPARHGYNVFIGDEVTPRRYGFLPGDEDMEGEIRRYRTRQFIRGLRKRST